MVGGYGEKNKAGQRESAPDDIKSSDVFKNTVKKLQDEVDRVKKDSGAEIGRLKKIEIDRGIMVAVKKVADENKWAVTDGLIELFVKGLKADTEFDVIEGKIIPVKDGKPLKDDLQNDLGVEELIKTTGSTAFTASSNDGRKAPENKPPAGSSKIEPFKNDMYYFNRVQAESDPDKLAAMRDQYQSQFSNK